MKDELAMPAPGGRHPLLLGAFLLAAVLWMLRDTAVAMVEIWWRSETFTHAFLVPPIALWLVWRRRSLLAGLPTRPMPWLLAPIAATCLVWLLAELASVAAASQFALVSLIVLCVPALFGLAVTRELLFPLGFLYFAVPFGEFLVPTLIEHTADFTIAALRFSGIPVYREGAEFVIPSGHWSVVEACSGVRYLIASLMVGTLFAHLNYRSTRRRLAFVGVAILVPVVANWLRAYMIVMIGHLSGNRLAVGVDHLIYGWVFFGVVIGLMFMIGARWADAHVDDDPVRPAAAGVEIAAAPVPGWAVAGFIVAFVAAAQGWLWQLEREPAAAGVPALELPGAPGWLADPAFEPGWSPGFANPSASAGGGYRQGDRRVWLWVGYYRQQGPERKLVTSTNTLAGERAAGWIQTGSERLSPGALGTPVRAADLRRTSSLTGATAQRLRVWQLYWVDGGYTDSDARAKLDQALARLMGRGDDGAVVLMAAPAGDEADVTLEAFARAQLAPLADRLATIRPGP